jgi:O-antigen/teichoic acid export membrane protein
MTAIILRIRPAVGGALLGLVLPELVVLGLLVIVVLKRPQLRLYFARPMAIRLVGFGLRNFLANLVDAIGSRLNLYVLSFYLAEEKLGVFSAANFLFLGLLMFPAALQRITFPALATRYAAQGRDAVTSPINRTLRYTLFLLGAATLLAIGLGSSLLEIMYSGSRDFQEAYLPLVVLMTCLPVAGIVKSIGATPASMGNPSWNMLHALTSLVMGTGLTMALVPRWGIVGAAWATTLSQFLAGAVFFVVLRFGLKIRLQNVVLVRALLLIAVLQGGAWLSVGAGWHRWLSTAIILTGYGLLTYGMKLITAADVLGLKRMFRPVGSGVS